MKPRELNNPIFVHPRALPPRLLALTVVFSAVFMLSGGANAGFFDKLKQKAEEAVKETLPDLDAEKRKVEKTITEPLDSNTPTGSKSAESSGSNAPLAYSVEYLMQRWPYKTPKGSPAMNVELRGVRLGQPLPDAHQALVKAGFSYMNQVGNAYNYRTHYIELNGQRKWIPQSEYGKVLNQPGFKSIRMLEMSIEAITPSQEIMAELSPYPADSLPNANQTVAVATDARSARRARSQRATTSQNAKSAPHFSGKPLYVSAVTYFQKFIGGERVEWKALLQKAREQFGEPNYALPDIQRAGAAYKTYNGSSLWYLDAALVEPAQVRKILASVEPDNPQSSIREMVWRDMLHPGIFAKVSYAKQGFNGYDRAVEAMRVSGAPYMGVFWKNGFRIELAWPFLKREASARGIYDKEQARMAQPKADVKF